MRAFARQHDEYLLLPRRHDEAMPVQFAGPPSSTVYFNCGTHYRVAAQSIAKILLSIALSNFCFLKPLTGRKFLLGVKKQIHNIGVKVVSRLLLNVFHDFFCLPCFSICAVEGKPIPHVYDRK